MDCTTVTGVNSLSEDTASSAFSDFVKHSSGLRESTELSILAILRNIHLDCNVRCIDARACDLLTFAKSGKAEASPLHSDATCHVETVYRPPYSRLSKEMGTLSTTIKFGQFKFSWNGVDLLVYAAEWTNPGGFSRTSKKQYIVVPHNTNMAVTIDTLILQAGYYCAQVSKEIYVYDQGYWSKSSDLWRSVQRASWEDVILKPETKKTLIEDIMGFFDAREEYEEFGVPWKRGIILHGLPGNGKTVSIKAIMKSLESRREPVPSLYVKSFENCNGGPQRSIREIFEHARTRAPCLLIFEDLDSLVTDKVRSYFLNEVDGIESNDGILMIGSTNHLEKLDPAISKRPSRFDRKYHYSLPAEAERLAYCAFWRQKLSKNPKIGFLEGIGDIVAKITDGFSFAYLKELFVTSLLHLLRTGPPETSKGTIAPYDTPSALDGEGNIAQETPSELDKANGKSIRDKEMAFDVPRELRDNLFLKVLLRQVDVLRADMESAEEVVPQVLEPSLPALATAVMQAQAAMAA